MFLFNIQPRASSDILVFDRNLKKKNVTNFSNSPIIYCKLLYPHFVSIMFFEALVHCFVLNELHWILFSNFTNNYIWNNFANYKLFYIFNWLTLIRINENELTLWIPSLKARIKPQSIGTIITILAGSLTRQYRIQRAFSADTFELGS